MRPNDQRPLSQTSRLWEQCQNPEEGAAWVSLVMRIQPRIEARCRARGVWGADTDEVVAEVYLRLVRYRDSFDWRQGTFHGWLSRLIRNAIVDVHRRRRPAEAGAEDELVDEQVDALSGLIEQEMQEAVEEALRRAGEADPHGAEVFRRMSAGETGNEVASALGMNFMAVYRARTRFLNLVREIALGHDRPGGEEG